MENRQAVQVDSLKLFSILKFNLVEFSFTPRKECTIQSYYPGIFYSTNTPSEFNDWKTRYKKDLLFFYKNNTLLLRQSDAFYESVNKSVLDIGKVHLVNYQRNNRKMTDCFGKQHTFHSRYYTKQTLTKEQIIKMT